MAIKIGEYIKKISVEEVDNEPMSSDQNPDEGQGTPDDDIDSDSEAPKNNEGDEEKETEQEPGNDSQVFKAEKGEQNSNIDGEKEAKSSSSDMNGQGADNNENGKTGSGSTGDLVDSEDGKVKLSHRHFKDLKELREYCSLTMFVEANDSKRKELIDKAESGYYTAEFGYKKSFRDVLNLSYSASYELEDIVSHDEYHRILRFLYKTGYSKLNYSKDYPVNELAFNDKAIGLFSIERAMMALRLKPMPKINRQINIALGIPVFVSDNKKTYANFVKKPIPKQVRILTYPKSYLAFDKGLENKFGIYVVALLQVLQRFGYKVRLDVVFASQDSMDDPKLIVVRTVTMIDYGDGLLSSIALARTISKSVSNFWDKLCIIKGYDESQRVAPEYTGYCPQHQYVETGLKKHKFFSESDKTTIWIRHPRYLDVEEDNLDPIEREVIKEYNRLKALQ